MAYKITDFTRHVAASADYPRGGTQNDPNGTLVSNETLTDMWQFFSKLMVDAGITPNSLPDNVTNGYQLVAALDARTTVFSSSGITFATVASPWADKGAPYYNVGYKVDQNEVAICGVAANPGAMPGGVVNILTLPVAARPASDVRCATWATYGGGGAAAVEIIIAASTGLMTWIPGAQSSVITLALDGIRYRKS